MALKKTDVKTPIIILSSPGPSPDSSPILLPTAPPKARSSSSRSAIMSTTQADARARWRSTCLKAMNSHQFNNLLAPESSRSGAAKWGEQDVLDLTMLSDETPPDGSPLTPELNHLPKLAPRPAGYQQNISPNPMKRKSPTTPPPKAKRPSASPRKMNSHSRSDPHSREPSTDEEDKPRVVHNKFSLGDLIDSIPLADRAPVGRRRLTRKKVLEDSDDEEEAVQPGEMSREEQIESDRVLIQTAAKRLGCKKSWVTVTIKEEVKRESQEAKHEVVKHEAIKHEEEHGAIKHDEAQEEEAGEEEGEGEGEEELPLDIKGKGKAKARSAPDPKKDLLKAFLDGSDSSDDSDDSDMVLHRPNFVPEKKILKKTPIDPNKTVVPSVNDDMEWIRGGDLGQRDASRQFKDITERKLMWRIPGMHTALLDHQVLGVDWMMVREMSEKRPRGGLVADAMGLGKTIQSIATMVLNPAPPPAKATDPTVTLIVAPVALLQQWKAELTQHAKNNNFSIHIHHGHERLHSPSAMRKFDVVITSYGAICNSYPSTRKPARNTRMTRDEEEVWWDNQWRSRGIFHRLKFWRVILDESHVLKNRISRTSLACQNLEALHTWALSGTPIQNTLDDIYPIFNFMRHPHVGSLDQFRTVTQGGGEAAAKRVQAVLRGCMMRRMKKDQLMGKDLIVLQKKRVRMVELEFGAEERGLYQCVEEKSRETMNKYIREGTVMKNYSDVLVMLLRLRQICDHPYLILTTINKDFTVADLDRALPGEIGMSSKSGLRQILDAARVVAMGDLTECSICLDAPEAPVITVCRHVFCRDCITNYIAERARINLPANCPLCNHKTGLDDLTNYRAAIPDLDSDSDSNPVRKKSKKAQNDEWLSNAGEFTHSAKTLALRDQLLEWRENHPGDKVVLFSQFTKMLDIVERVLDEEGWGTVRYQGDMTLVEREEALSKFRGDPECWVMLTSLRAGGVGLNLVVANLVLSLDLWWNGAVELQAFDRVHRMGQKKEVFVSRFIVKNTVEQRILDLQRKKEKISNAALGDGVGTNLGKLTQSELMGLFGSVVSGPGGLRIVADDQRRGGGAVGIVSRFMDAGGGVGGSVAEGSGVGDGGWQQDEELAGRMD